jgi:hypothetical protein
MAPADREKPPLALLVFSQRGDARVDIDGWGAHAERFFATRIGLAEEKRYDPGTPFPSTDDARFVVAPAGGTPGIRAVHARPRDDADLHLADAIDARAGGTGLALLARRCPTVWIVERESEADSLALRLAAILASALLGPILDAHRTELFGVKTARAKLEALLGS